MPLAEYTREEREQLLLIARESIARGVATGQPALPGAVSLTSKLSALRATFVTLLSDGILRGCTGSLEAVRPLAEDVARSAFHSAFHDPRFYPVTDVELADLTLEISVLSPMQPMAVRSERELLDRLRPGVDGLVLEDGRTSATFLPKVWEQLPEPDEFLAALKRKAGMSVSHWSANMVVYRYHTETFSEESGQQPTTLEERAS